MNTSKYNHQDAREKTGYATQILTWCLLLLITSSATNATPNSSDFFDPTEIMFDEVGKITLIPINRPARTTPPAPAKKNIEGQVSIPQQQITAPQTSQPPIQQPPQMTIILEQPLVQQTPQNQNQQKQTKSVDIIVESAPVKEIVQQEKLSAPVVSNTGKNKDTLAQMIEQIQAIRFDSGKTSTEQFVTEEPQSTPEQQVINTPEPPKTVTEEKNIETKSKEQFANQNLISQTTLSDLEAFIENPKQAENPLLIAEVLFSDGFEKQAAVFYNEAIDRLKREGTLSIHDKAWLLLQTATCFKTYDNKQASKLFKEVIAECPSSTWAPIAKTQSDLVDWLQTEKPQELIKQCKSELTMAVNERRSQ